MFEPIHYSDLDTSFLAARYLRYALQLHLAGNSLFYLADVWSLYMDIATSSPGNIEWTNFDKCIETLHMSDKPLRTFVSPSQFSKLAGSLLLCASILLCCLLWPQISDDEQRSEQRSKHF